MPFVTASVLPFILGSLIAKGDFNMRRFLLGLIAVAATHLSANLLNDYADSKSGVDWKDKRFFGFFGGSKLIQEKVFPENFYRNTAVVFSAIASLSVASLALIMKNASIVGYFVCILLFAWSYSAKPLQFSYRRLGEIVIFLLFGPAVVMGAYFIQTALFPDRQSFFLSLPAGFLVTAILFSNEVPDFLEDKEAGKFTWVSFLGPQKAYWVYYGLIAGAFLSIVLNFVYGYLTYCSLIAFIFAMLAIKAGGILKKHCFDKTRLIESSKLTIALHTLVCIVIIADLLICRKS